MKNKPNIIYLQLEHRVWCSVPILETDVPYYSEEFTIEFTKWCATNYIRGSKVWMKNLEDTKFYTTKELLEEFKKTRNETTK